jgi:type III pantothenate kinase
MLLAINVGNTHTKFGLYAGDTLQAHWRLESARTRTADEWAALLIPLLAGQGITLPDIQAAIGSSVVPPITTALRELAERHLGVRLLLAGPGLALGTQARVANPREVGVDRLVNSAAAFRRYGGPCLVLDCGTATTFNVVNPDGDYIGGVIAPGLGISADALFRLGAQLYPVPLVAPPHAIGQTTVECMQAGVVLGYAGLVEGLVGLIKAEMAAQGWDRVPVIATGGLSSLIASTTRVIDHLDPNLTLDGLRMIYELNRGQGSGIGDAGSEAS